ncbi:hypothetical protein PITC_055810 [Penicillium italicum]|uniref:Uncharacterized protein n=1 Tax=Penicillium italicum TaxID=40296 RepID=A0A0A2L278_PENIT|nr:hypothetical protein PITC_055810 [Penicillium italicum]
MGTQQSTTIFKSTARSIYATSNRSESPPPHNLTTNVQNMGAANNIPCSFSCQSSPGMTSCDISQIITLWPSGSMFDSGSASTKHQVYMQPISETIEAILHTDYLWSSGAASRT